MDTVQRIMQSTLTCLTIMSCFYVYARLMRMVVGVKMPQTYNQKSEIYACVVFQLPASEVDHGEF